jgi:cell division protein FtsL
MGPRWAAATKQKKDRASLEKRFKQPTRCNKFLLLIFLKSALHVAVDKLAHPQEHFLSVYTAYGTKRRYSCP